MFGFQKETANNGTKTTEQIMRDAMREVAAKQAKVSSPDIPVAVNENAALPSSFSELAKAIRDGAEPVINEAVVESAPSLQEVEGTSGVIYSEDLVPEITLSENGKDFTGELATIDDVEVVGATATDNAETLNFTAEQVSAWQASDVYELRALGDYSKMRGRALEINAELAKMAEELENKVNKELARGDSYMRIAEFAQGQSVDSDELVAELVKTLHAKEGERVAKAEGAKAEFEEKEARLKSEIGPHMEIDPKIMMLAKVLDSMRVKNSLLSEGRTKLMPAANDNSRIEAARISQESGEDTAALFIHALTAKAA